jgi:hypothetical protein
MNNVRFVPAALDLAYEEVDQNVEKFEREFNVISESEENSITQGIKHVKMRGETDETNLLMLNILSELYRKMDKIEQLLVHGNPKRLALACEGYIESIGLEHFKLTENILEPGKHYYGRLELTTFPKREIAFYFEGVEPSVAKIEKIHVRDKEAWGYFMTACERIMIRQLKGNE